MALIVGLGNVGAEYEGTRHNIGFDIVEKIAQKMGCPFQAGNGPLSLLKQDIRVKTCF